MKIQRIRNIEINSIQIDVESNRYELHTQSEETRHKSRVLHTIIITTTTTTTARVSTAVRRQTDTAVRAVRCGVVEWSGAISTVRLATERIDTAIHIRTFRSGDVSLSDAAEEREESVRRVFEARGGEASRQAAAAIGSVFDAK